MSQIVNYFVKCGLLSEAPSEELFRGKSEGVVRTLVQAGLVDQAEAFAALGEHLHVKVVDLDASLSFDAAQAMHVLDSIDASNLWQHRVVPLHDDGRTIVLAVSDPYDVEIRQKIQFSSGRTVSIVLAPEEQIPRALNQISSREPRPIENIETLAAPEHVEIIKGIPDDIDLAGAHADAAPVVALSHKILADAVDGRASDIHLDPSQEVLSIRYRIDGTMHLAMDLPKRIHPHVISRFKILAGMDISERRRPQDGRFTVRYGRAPVDIRASTVPTPYGEKLVMRVLVSDLTKLSFPSLGASREMQAQLVRVLEKRGKLLLVTGPTGSGKTTTLYTCLNYLRDGSNNIVTVEDPIEYRIPGINQIQVNEAIGMTFAKTLRSILRQDPDVILVGEIRDCDTAKIAFQAAQTGHLVLSTLHTNDAPSAVSRLIGIGLEELVIASALEGVLAQRLVRTVCPKCVTEVSGDEVSRNREYLEAYQIEPSALRYGAGCNACRQLGFIGQQAVFSYLSVSEQVAVAIRARASEADIVSAARDSGFRTLEEQAAVLVAEGKTTFDEVKQYLESGEELARYRSRAKVISVVTSTPQSAVSIAQSSGGRSRVLLIEDDRDMRDILSMVLQKEMYEVIEAENGQEGLQQIFDNPPHIVLCDLMMPKMDGREFLKRIRSHPGSRAIPVIILTAVDSEDNEVDLLDLGATDFVSKTDSTNVMLSRVRSVLAKN